MRAPITLRSAHQGPPGRTFSGRTAHGNIQTIRSGNSRRLNTTRFASIIGQSPLAITLGDDRYGVFVHTHFEPQYTSFIRNVFAFKGDVWTQCVRAYTHILLDTVSPQAVVVGVHIRRGDMLLLAPTRPELKAADRDYRNPERTKHTVF